MNNQLLSSPVNSNKFIWMASYSDGTFLSEFNFDSQTENNFYSIDKDSLIRFGLVGYGLNLYYEVFGGVFKIAGRVIEVYYQTNDKKYPLTGHQLMYNDVIQYKNADAYFDVLGQNNDIPPQISQYNFGYKQNLNVNEVNFNYKAICSLPYGKPAFMTIRLVSDKDLDGKLVIRKDYNKLFEFDAPMEANVGYELNWEVNM